MNIRSNRNIFWKMYNKQEIQLWIQELIDIPREISKKQQEKVQPLANLNQLQPQLKKTIDQITPIDIRIKQIEARIKIIQSQNTIKTLTDEIKPHQTELTRLEPDLRDIQNLIAPIDATINQIDKLIKIKKLQTSLDNWRQKNIPHQNALREIPNLLNMELRLDILNHSIDSTRKQINELELQLAREAASHLQQPSGGVAVMQSANPMPQPSGGISSTPSASGGVAVMQTAVPIQKPSAGAAIMQAIGTGIHMAADAARALQLQNLKSELQKLCAEQSSLQNQRDQLDAQRRFHQSESDSIKREIHHLEMSLGLFDYHDKEAAKKQSLSQLEADLQEQCNAKKPLDHRRNRLKTEIASHRSEVTSRTMRIDQLENLIHSQTPTAKPYCEIDDLKILADKLNQCHEAKEPLVREKKDLETHINVNTQLIYSADKRIKELNERQWNLEANTYLLNLRNNPNKLLTELKNTILELSKDYDDHHSCDQSIPVRLCLAEIENKINFIVHSSIEDQPGNLRSEGQDNFQKKYYQICGLLWHMQKRLDPNDHEFAQLINYTLQNHPIHSQECLEEYYKLQKECPEMQDMTLESLKLCEARAYAAARDKTIALLNRIPFGQSHELNNLKYRGDEVLYAMELESDLDIKFSTRVLTKTHELLQHPENRELQNEYKNLATQKKKDQPSTCKKILGAILGFVGAVILAASVITKVITLALAAPITTLGVVGGAFLLASGISLFQSGKQKGVSKKITDFLDASHKAPSLSFSEMKTSSAAAKTPEPSAPPAFAMMKRS